MEGGRVDMDGDAMSGMLSERPLRRCSWCSTQMAGGFHVEQWLHDQRHADYWLCRPCFGYIGSEPSDDLIADVISDVAEAHGITVEALLSPSRRVAQVAARHEAMAELRLMGCSLKRISWALRRDHTSIVHGIQKMQRLA